MSKTSFSQLAEDYRRIEQAIGYIETNRQRQPELEDIAAAVNLSKFHFQRLFKRWAGISPIQFLQYLTVEYAKQRLAESESVLGAALDAGLSGPGRLHDLFVTFEAMTPGQFKRLGADLEIRYGIHPTPFGECLLAVTDRGICHLSFVDSTDTDTAVDRLRSSWPSATLMEQPAALRPFIEHIFSPSGSSSRPFHLLLRGTNFQVNVWRALLSIPAGKMLTYSDVAAYIGKPDAHRAVANAVAANPVGYLIPCHRVIAKSGQIHKYRWGSVRKKAILGREAASSYH